MHSSLKFEAYAEICNKPPPATRAQILIGCLQLQEPRVNLIATQLSETRRALVAQEAAQSEPMATIKRGDDLIASGFVGVIPNLEPARARLASLQQEAQRLRAQEATLINQLGAEQARWRGACRKPLPVVDT
jgi:hypothetical protein